MAVLNSPPKTFSSSSYSSSTPLMTNTQQLNSPHRGDGSGVGWAVLGATKLIGFATTIGPVGWLAIGAGAVVVGVAIAVAMDNSKD